MRKRFVFFILIIISCFVFFPNCVKANYGDLNYRITDVIVNNNSISFKGWAFIHRTQNYVKNGLFNDDGDMKVLIQAYDPNSKNENVIATKVVKLKDNDENGNLKDYNFYCDLFLKSGKGGSECDSNDYKSKDVNACINDDYGTGPEDNNTKCLYEDIAFIIEFDFSEFAGYDEVAFKIAASNKDFEVKKDYNYGKKYDKEKGYYEYEGELYTQREGLLITREALPVSLRNSKDDVIVFNDHFKIKADSLATEVEFFTKFGTLYIWGKKQKEVEKEVEKEVLKCQGKMHGGYVDMIECKKDKNHTLYEIVKVKEKVIEKEIVDDGEGYVWSGSTYGSYKIQDGVFYGGCKSNIYELSYENGIYTIEPDYNPVGHGSRMERYYLKVLGTLKYAPDGKVYCPSSDTPGVEYKTVQAYGSHVKFKGNTFKGNPEPDIEKCEVVTPSSGNLVCNGNKTFNSDCDKLTVTSDKGSANVSIKQEGTISSVLTPDRTFAGGGFNFGIIYRNTIRWNYTSGQDISDELHNSITKVMNDKLKDYSSYVANLNITELKMNGVSPTFNNLVKKCTTSSENIDYYNKELVVSCLFTIPSSKTNYDGSVDYNIDVSGVDINNKYYTPINHSGAYKIEASIVGMNRITDNAALSDSKENGKVWTGNWEDTFTECNIDLYKLLVYDEKYIYRPIDIFNPFPSRNAGINWFDWYNQVANKERLENTYSKVQYSSVLNNNLITNIKNYNKEHNYLEWDSIDEDGESSFITGNDYIIRVGGN